MLKFAGWAVLPLAFGLSFACMADDDETLLAEDKTLLAAAPSPTSLTLPLAAVAKVDLGRYVGRWYEIARLPNKFQNGCRESTANYSLKADGKIQVINECVKGENREVDRVEGDAEVVDSETWAKLRVNFVPSWIRWIGVGWGNYWIIDLDAD